MPGMDGTGPRGMGMRAGLGRRACRSAANRNNQYGCGFGRGSGICRYAATESRESLNAVKTLLQERLAAVDKRLQEL
ncbi:MAG: DUF5320 domain-containing protein [Christensenellales bacterium]